MKHSIALKIFGLAVGILVVTVAIAVLTNFEVIGLGKDVAIVATRTIPLAKEASELDECCLERRIAYQALYCQYTEPKPDNKAIERKQRSFEESTKCFHGNIDDIRKMLAVLPDDPEERNLYASARELVGQMETAFASETAMARMILKHRQDGNLEKAEELNGFDNQSEALLDAQGDKLRQIAMDLAEISARRAKSREIWVLWSSTATTFFAVLTGLVVAWLISRNLARPIAQLLQTTRAVQAGDLSIHLGKLPEDEIGQLGESFNSMVHELRRKQEMQKAIGSYIDPRIVEEVILAGRKEDMAGQKRVMTILFTDLVGFTTLGEHLTPGGLVKVLNRFFTLMSECVQAENGIIDKFIGDAIMAYWGPPFVGEDEEAAAGCRAAFRQLEALTQFQAELPDLMGLRKNLPEVKIRIGLATGEVVVGNIGSETARNYTVMGDVVNIASRMESANNVYGTRILISEETRRMADRIIQAREIDWIAVKGKSEPVQVHELISIDGELSPEWEERRMRFGEGLEAYRRQDWPAAEMIFQELVEKYQDHPARAFLERVKILHQNPPGAAWDGVWRMSTK
jgi:class 3 adenylate cyclase